jgi:branched-chain amino acid transport system substrate-binding protein
MKEVRKMKIFKLLTCLLVGVMFILSSGEVFAQAKGPIKIGSLSALTGVEAARWARTSVMSSSWSSKVNATGGINGQKVELCIEDDQLQPTVAVNAAKLVYKDDVLLIIGTVNSPTTLAAVEVTMEAKVPQLCIAVAAKITQMNNPWIARIIPVDTILGGHVANFAVTEKKLEDLAILHDSTDYGKGGMVSVVDAMSKLKLKPVVTETFNNEDKDFSSQLTKIKNSGAKGSSSGAFTFRSESLPKQKLGLTMPILGSSGILQGNFLELAKDNAEVPSFLTSPWIIQTLGFRPL